MSLPEATQDAAAAAAAAAASSRDARSIDPKVWTAIAGKGINIDVGAKVHYFPKGHLEQAAILSHDFSKVTITKHHVLCRVLDVRFLADQETDEVFAKITLDPRVHLPPENPTAVSGDEDPPENPTAVYTKVLTDTDVSGSTGFNVPKKWVHSIFPALPTDGTFQFLRIGDLNGKEYQIKHTYRDTAARHVLTTGWTKFVNEKYLVCDDMLFFLKNSAGQVFIGIRRKNEDRSRVAAERVAAAIIAAEEGDRVFEVEYYPRRNSADFLVSDERVAAAMLVQWVVGMKVAMRVTDDDGRVHSHTGVVDAIMSAPNGPRAQWRMLKVRWEQADMAKDKHHMSPWEVEVLISEAAVQSGMHGARQESDDISRKRTKI